MGVANRSNMSDEKKCEEVKGKDSSGKEIQPCLMGGSWTEGRKGSPEDCMPHSYGFGWQGFGMHSAHHLAAPAAHFTGHARRSGVYGCGQNWNHGTEFGQGYGRGYGYCYGGYAPGACAVEGGRRVYVNDCNFELTATPAYDKTWMS